MPREQISRCVLVLWPRYRWMKRTVISTFNIWLQQCSLVMLCVCCTEFAYCDISRFYPNRALSAVEFSSQITSTVHLLISAQVRRHCVSVRNVETKIAISITFTGDLVLKGEWLFMPQQFSRHFWSEYRLAHWWHPSNYWKIIQSLSAWD